MPTPLALENMGVKRDDEPSILATVLLFNPYADCLYERLLACLTHFADMEDTQFFFGVVVYS